MFFPPSRFLRLWIIEYRRIPPGLIFLKYLSEAGTGSPSRDNLIPGVATLEFDSSIRFALNRKPFLVSRRGLDMARVKTY